MNKYLLVLLINCVDPIHVLGQPQVEWINSNPSAFLNEVIIDNAGNLVLTGTIVGLGASLDLFTMKIDPSGNTLWVASYDSAYRDEEVSAVCVDANNNIYITGDDTYRGLTFKYSKNGSLIWKVYPDNDGLDNFCDSQSNIYTVGRDTDVVIRKYDSTGASVGAFGIDTNYSIPYHIQLNEAGDIFIGGTELVAQHLYFFCEKYDANGILQWHTPYIPNDTIPQYPWNMVLDNKSNAYMVASAKKGGEEMYCAMRFGSDGNIDWVSFENFGNTFYDSGTDITTDLNGAAYVTGRSFDGTISSCMTLKYDSAGTLLWSHKIPGSIPPPVNQKVRFYNGNVYILTPHHASFGNEFLLKKLNMNGDSIWEVTYPGTPYLLIIDSFENVFVSGLDSTGDSAITIKYSQPVGINSIFSRDPSLKVFPNPFHISTSIQVPSIENRQNDLHLEIYDLPGKFIEERRIHKENSVIFNRGALQNGMYILKLISDQKIIATTKIVIQ